MNNFIEVLRLSPNNEEALNFVAQIFLDINNYRQERESLIGELARAAAKKVMITKTEKAATKKARKKSAEK